MDKKKDERKNMKSLHGRTELKPYAVLIRADLV